MRKFIEHNPIGKEELDAGKKLSLVIFLVFMHKICLNFMVEKSFKI